MLREEEVVLPRDEPSNWLLSAYISKKQQTDSAIGKRQ